MADTKTILILEANEERISALHRMRGKLRLKLDGASWVSAEKQIEYFGV